MASGARVKAAAMETEQLRYTSKLETTGRAVVELGGLQEKRAPTGGAQLEKNIL